MGDGRYYTFNQFFTTVILTFLVIFLTASLALSYYRNKDKKSDRHLIFILLLVDVIAILKFIEELYMFVHVCQILRFIQIVLMYIAAITFIDYLLTYFPSVSYGARKRIRWSVSITLMAVLITGIVWWSIVGRQFLFRHFDFRRVYYKAHYPAVWTMLFIITLLAVLRIYFVAERNQEAGKIRLVMCMIVVLYLCPMLVYIVVSSMVGNHLEAIEIMFVFLFGVTMGVILNSNVTYGITPFTFEKIRSAMDDYVFVVDANGKMVFKNDNAMNTDIFTSVDNFDVYHPEDAFALKDKETRKEHEAVYIRLANNNNDIFISYRFAYLAASTLKSMGIKAHVFAEAMPTPVLSYAVKEMQAGLGIVITASHNPPKYNGYKVYDHRGVQINPYVAEKVADYYNKESIFNNQGVSAEHFSYVDDSILNSYIKSVEDLLQPDNKLANELSVVYTALYGTGSKTVSTLLKHMDYHATFIQQEPDTTLVDWHHQTPESRDAYKEAIK